MCQLPTGVLKPIIYKIFAERIWTEKHGHMSLAPPDLPLNKLIINNILFYICTQIIWCNVLLNND